MKKKIMLSALLAAAVASTMIGCSSQSGNSGNSTAKEAGAEASADAGGKTVDWPTKTVTVTLPYNAGGDTDTYCRLMAQKLQEKYGQNFVVVNMTGGSGIVAAKEIMAKNPDGYNILFNHTGASLVQEATGVADFSYTDNFTNVATVAQDNSYTIVVKKSSGWETLEDMIAYAKEHPGEVRYSQVYGSVTHYVCSMMEQTMGVEFNKLDVGTGTPERLAAFMGDQVDVLAVNYMNIADYIETGEFIALGVCSPERVPGLDDIPTLLEQGYDVISQKNYEVKFPKGADEAIVAELSQAIKEITEDPEFGETLAKYYAEPYYRSAEECNEQDRAEVETLREFFKDEMN